MENYSSFVRRVLKNNEFKHFLDERFTHYKFVGTRDVLPLDAISAISINEVFICTDKQIQPLCTYALHKPINYILFLNSNVRNKYVYTEDYFSMDTNFYRFLFKYNSEYITVSYWRTVNLASVDIYQFQNGDYVYTTILKYDNIHSLVDHMAKSYRELKDPLYDVGAICCL